MNLFLTWVNEVWFLIIRGLELPLSAAELLYVYTVVYVVLAVGLFAARWRSFRTLMGEARGTITRAAFPRQERAPGGDD